MLPNKRQRASMDAFFSGNSNAVAFRETGRKGGEKHRTADFRDAAAAGLLAGLPCNTLPALLLAGAFFFVQADATTGENNGYDPKNTELHRLLHNPVHFIALGKALKQRNGKGRLRGGKN